MVHSETFQCSKENMSTNDAIKNLEGAESIEVFFKE